MKCVMIIDEELPSGIAANTAAALGISLSGRIGDLVGNKLVDLDGRLHEGVTNIAIPILVSSREELRELHDSIMERSDSDILLIGFNEVAQKSLNYEDYEKKLALKLKDQIDYLGVCIYGPRSKVNKLTGKLKMMK
ncbi:MAG: DUF2000 domain-containing protein [Pseudomonadota bacterium]